MKKIAVLIVVVVLAVCATAASAADKGETMVGNLFLFQKCDASLIPAADAVNPQYDSSGCPLAGNGPWPIFLENGRWGQMRYNLLGDRFRFSFQGKRLLSQTDYTLIYYPDAWPGKGLICLGRGATNPNGNVEIRGDMAIPAGLPAPYDKNFNPVEPSGASGAKIWLVPSADVKCEAAGDIDPETGLAADPAQMLSWNPASYLFEGNMIVYQYTAPVIDEDANDDDGDVDTDFDNSGSLNRQPPERFKGYASDNGGNGGKGKNR